MHHRRSRIREARRKPLFEMAAMWFLIGLSFLFVIDGAYSLSY